MTFDEAFDRLMAFEGGYSNNPADPGAETMWGITARVARAEGYIGDMRQLPQSEAKRIARRRYWDPVQCDLLPDQLRYAVFDAAYNSGPEQSAKWLQMAVGATPDGDIGPVTLKAASAAGGDALPALCGERIDFLTSLPTWGAFGKGWARRVAAILKDASNA